MLAAGFPLSAVHTATILLFSRSNQADIVGQTEPGETKQEKSDSLKTSVCCYKRVNVLSRVTLCLESSEQQKKQKVSVSVADILKSSQVKQKLSPVK